MQQHTDIIVVREKVPSHIIYLLERCDEDDEYYLRSIITGSNSKLVDSEIDMDIDLSNYKFMFTRDGRDEYCHHDDYEPFMKTYAEMSVKQLITKLNLL